jgi:predicted Fe-Mo cluster-binding NifX family protein
MIIVVSSSGDSKHSMTDERFGRCAVFAVYNTENDTFEFVDNTAVASGHGAGISAAQFVSELNADVVLTGNLGPKAKQVLDASGIKGFHVSEMSVEKAVRAYQNGDVQEITSAGPSHQG